METTTTTTTTAKRIKKFYIGQRNNPFFNKPEYNGYGQLSNAEAKRKEKCTYGSIILTSYETKLEYLTALEELKTKGFNIH